MGRSSGRRKGEGSMALTSIFHAGVIARIEKGLDDGLKELKKIVLNNPALDYAIEQGWNGMGSWVAFLRQLAAEGDEVAAKLLHDHNLLSKIYKLQDGLWTQLKGLGPLLPYLTREERERLARRIQEFRDQLVKIDESTTSTSSSHRDRPRKGEYKEAEYLERRAVEMTDAQKEALDRYWQRRQRAKADGDRTGQVRATEELAVEAAKIFAHDVLGLRSEPIYVGPVGDEASQDRFDLVYEEGGQIYVIEAKGGGARLRTAFYKGQHVQQGTREYLRRTAELMRRLPDKNAQEAAEKILQALEAYPSSLVYSVVQVPLAHRGKPDALRYFQYGRFNISK